MIDLFMGEKYAEAIEARPSSATDGAEYPGILLFSDAIGIRPEIEKIAQRIADWGYIVLAPNLFYREGLAKNLFPQEGLLGDGEREEFIGRIRPVLDSHTRDLIVEDIPRFVTSLKSLPSVKDGPIGVIGFCNGVRVAFYAAAQHPDDIKAVAGFHGGRLVTDADDSPHRELHAAKAEFVLGHADNDQSNTRDHVDRLDDTLREAGATFTSEIYAGAPHGYTMEDTPMFNEQARERAFASAKELFTRTL